VAAWPEVSQSPDAGEDGRDEGDPLGGGIDAVSEEIAEAGRELARDNRGAHVPGVLAECGWVYENGDDCAEREGGERAQEDAVAAGNGNPDKENEREGQKQMRLEGAEPECSAGSERMRLVKAEKKDESAEDKDGGLAEDDAEKRGRKTVSKPGELAAGFAEETPEDSHACDKECEHDERPGKCGGGWRDETQGVSERQCPWCVAHVVGAGTAKAGIAFDAADGVGVVGIAVLDELAARSPIHDEVATRDGTGIEGQDGEKEDGEDDAERAGNSDEESRKVALGGQVEGAFLIQDREIIGAQAAGFADEPASVGVDAPRG